MYYALRTMGYFLAWGLIYGFLLGVWSTTVIFPGLGTMYGLVWGPGIGAVCGLLSGVIVAITQTMTFDTDTDLTTYQRYLGRAIGLLASIAAPVVMLATSQGILWRITGRYETSPSIFIVDCLIAVVICGGLAAAYIAHTYPLWLAHLRLRQAHQDVPRALKTPLRALGTTLRNALTISLTPYLSQRWLKRLRLAETDETILLSEQWHVAHAALAILRRAFNWPTLVLAGVGGALIHLRNLAQVPFNLSIPAIGALMGIGLISALIVVLSFGNAALMVFLRTLVFSQQRAAVSPRYRRFVMTGTAFVLTSLLALYAVRSFRDEIIWAFVALWPILMTRYVYQAFPLFDVEQDKAKRKEKHADLKLKNTLALNEEMEDEMVYEPETAQKQDARS